jgi:CRP-like cAMP-binding protein
VFILILHFPKTLVRTDPILLYLHSNSNMENFVKKVKSIANVCDTSINGLSQVCFKHRFRKNDCALDKANISNDIYFVSNGLLRMFYFKQDKEISEWFAFENSFCFSIISYFQKAPSKLIIQCLEDSEIIFVARESLNKLKNRNFEIANFDFNIISRSLIASQERILGIQFETALTRYETAERLYSACTITIYRYFFECERRDLKPYTFPNSFIDIYQVIFYKYCLKL